jgi:hypothetical protein
MTTWSPCPPTGRCDHRVRTADNQVSISSAPSRKRAWARTLASIEAPLAFWRSANRNVVWGSAFAVDAFITLSPPPVPDWKEPSVGNLAPIDGNPATSYPITLWRQKRRGGMTCRSNRS